MDDYLISKRDGVELRLHTPTPREIVMKHDAPWEGNACTYCTIFRDGDRIRMWYTVSTWFDKDIPAHPVYYCYDESTDGIHWTRPELGLFEYNNSTKNNIVWSAPDLDNFMVFKDLNPACRPGENYKAVSSGERGGARGLLALASPDGLHWSALGGKPIITKGAFDTLNVAFWDSVHSCYFCYIRGFHGPGIRDIRVSTSKDFATWTDPVEIKYVDSPDEPMYTNNIAPYYRAPS